MSPLLYVTLGVSDLDRAGGFYDAILATIGWSRSAESEPDEGYLTYGPSYDDGASLQICLPFDGKAPTPGNGTMVALRAASEAEVHAFHATALAEGGSSEGAPGTRPHYSPSFYVAYVRDLDGNKLACVFHRHGMAG